jgi:hypothetical protein
MNHAESGGDLFNGATPQRSKPLTGHQNTSAGRVKSNAVIIDLREPSTRDIAWSAVAQLTILLHQ